jgi:site-specific DNA-methyltransferase (adenine-specific)
MLNLPLPRLDTDKRLRDLLLPYTRFKKGTIFQDTVSGHRIGCIDSSNPDEVSLLMTNNKAALAIHDPPYNFVAFEERQLKEFLEWSRKWINISYDVLDQDASLYIWLGADQNRHYQPLPQFMEMMQTSGFNSKSFITMRNQRGYGTQKNWMAIRQELLFYTKGEPEFFVNAEYTDIPKVLKGYYKKVNGVETENIERSKSDNIRAGNVWIDIQQVFYRVEENVNGCYAQKPLKAIERIINASSRSGDNILDLFSHSGTTLLAAEKTGRVCFTADNDPLYCEITARRLEHYRKEGKTGWQNSSPFAEEIQSDKKLKAYLRKNYNYSIEMVNA